MEAPGLHDLIAANEGMAVTESGIQEALETAETIYRLTEALAEMALTPD